MRLLIAGGAGLAFGASLIYFGFLYAVGFDSPASSSGISAPILTNVLLFTAFALHHSVFARSGFKAWLTRRIPPPLERATYVWIASLLFAGVCVAWQPVNGVAWHTTGTAAWSLRGLQLLGVFLTLGAARRLDVFELAGIRQVLERPSERVVTLDEHGLYGIVRHPIYLGWLFLVWPAPVMNGTRLVFAVISSLYLFIAIPLEERDLRRTFGSAYDTYAARVRSRVLPGIY